MMADRHEVIANEWRERARELADWAKAHVVNRGDVWGQYGPVSPSDARKSGRSYRAMTLPVKAMRGSDNMVTLDKLARHFSSHQHQKQIIGLHAKSAENTSLWLAVDLDMHDPDAADAALVAEHNFLAALAWWDQLDALGYDPLLIDSNGMGGFHLIISFAEPAPTADVFAFGKALVADWETHNLVEEPEIFPKSPGRKDSLGSWLRLPGLHHTRRHFSRVWSGEDWMDEPWLTGNAAIDCLIDSVPGPLPPPADDEPKNLPGPKTKKPKTGAKAPKRSAASRKTRFTPTAAPKVCVDLDGVLAQRISWQGSTVIGDPIPGAVEFTRSLAERCEIIILTARLSKTSTKKALDETEAAIREWLERHGFAFSSIHTGTSKPPAIAYIDDHAVPCRPEDEGQAAYTEALAHMKEKS